MRNVRALIAYDGSEYYGWQRQAGFESVQAELESALSVLTGDAISVHGSGRTDTGVHALGQVASFHVDTRLADDRLRNALNAHLPRDMAVRRVETCADDFHARFSARAKRYAYLWVTRRTRPVFGRKYGYWVRSPLDLDAMRRAAAVLRGRHDFAAFATSGSPRQDTVRTLESVHLVARRARLGLVVQGDGFLYNMVRNIAGTLHEVGIGKRDARDVERVLASRDRREAGPTAPPHGLFLVRVLYPEPVFREVEPGRAGAFD